MIMDFVYERKRTNFVMKGTGSKQKLDGGEGV
jgi:hypothetical protein